MINFAQIPIFSRSFSVEYQAILDKAESLGYTLPNSSIQVAQNAYLEKMKSNGYWYSLDLFYQFRTGDSGLSDFATINWINPNSYQISKVNSPSYNGDRFLFNNSSSYLDTGWNPTSHAIYYTASSACAFTYVNAAGSPEDSTNAMWGLIATLGSFYTRGYNGGQRINRGSDIIADLTGVDYKALNVSGSGTNLTQAYNGTTKTLITQTSPTLPNGTVCIGRFNNLYGNIANEMFGTGSSKSETEHNTIRQDHLDYVASL